jgi:hypothetical protein
LPVVPHLLPRVSARLHKPCAQPPHDTSLVSAALLDQSD